MKEIQIPASACPHCGHQFDACSLIDLNNSLVGSLTICIECAEVLIFDRHLKIQKLEPDELRRLSLKDPAGYANLLLLQQVVRTIGQDSGGDRAS